jgi:hypothetical protein
MHLFHASDEVQAAEQRSELSHFIRRQHTQTWTHTPVTNRDEDHTVMREVGQRPEDGCFLHISDVGARGEARVQMQK